MADLGYPAALGLTLAVEVPLWTGLIAWALEVPVRRAAVVAVVVNVVSHPLLWFVLVPVLDAATGPTVVGILAAEALVVLGEAILARILLRRDLGVLVLVSVAANAASFAVGLVLSGA